mgnify:CR=1 FL=1
MNIYFLLWLFLLHFIGDFVFQTRHIANNKGKNFHILFYHVSIYIFVLGLGLLPFSKVQIIGEFIGYNFWLHFFTDTITSKITKYFWDKQNIYAFFTTIGFDQFLHIVALSLTYNWLFVNN